MVQPDFIFRHVLPKDDPPNSSLAINMTNITSSENDDMKKPFLLFGEISGQTELITGIGLVILAAFCATLVAVSTKRKTIAEFCLWKIMFWVGVVGMAWPSIVSLITKSFTWIPDLKIIGLLLTDSIMVMAGIVTYILALRKISYLIVSIIMSITIAFNLVPQYLIIKGQFVERLVELEIVGAVLTIIAASLPTLAEIIKLKGIGQVK